MTELLVSDPILTGISYHRPVIVGPDPTALIVHHWTDGIDTEASTEGRTYLRRLNSDMSWGVVASTPATHVQSRTRYGAVRFGLGEVAWLECERHVSPWRVRGCRLSGSVIDVTPWTELPPPPAGVLHDTVGISSDGSASALLGFSSNTDSWVIPLHWDGTNNPPTYGTTIEVPDREFTKGFHAYPVNGRWAVSMRDNAYPTAQIVRHFDFGSFAEGTEAVTGLYEIALGLNAVTTLDTAPEDDGLAVYAYGSYAAPIFTPPQLSDPTGDFFDGRFWRSHEWVSGEWATFGLKETYGNATFGDDPNTLSGFQMLLWINGEQEGHFELVHNGYAYPPYSMNDHRFLRLDNRRFGVVGYDDYAADTVDHFQLRAFGYAPDVPPPPRLGADRRGQRAAFVP